MIFSAPNIAQEGKPKVKHEYDPASRDFKDNFDVLHRTNLIYHFHQFVCV